MSEEKQRIRGHRRYALIRDIAQGVLNHEELAEKYGVAVVSIVGFIRRNTEEINMVKADQENEFAGLWISVKRSRIAEYQETVEAINEILYADEQAGLDATPGLVRMKHEAMKSVAEEMGHLPTRSSVTVEGTSVHYIIDGVDPKELT
jgi:hypothetical protein